MCFAPKHGSPGSSRFSVLTPACSNIPGTGGHHLPMALAWSNPDDLVDFQWKGRGMRITHRQSLPKGWHNHICSDWKRQKRIQKVVSHPCPRYSNIKLSFSEHSMKIPLKSTGELIIIFIIFHNVPYYFPAKKRKLNPPAVFVPSSVRVQHRWTATYHLDDRDAAKNGIEIPGFTSEISTNAQMVENDWNGTDTL